MKRLALTCLFTLLASIAACGATTQPAAPPALATTPAADQTPVISFDDLQAFLRAPRDEAVVLDFWATWCEPCVKTLPTIAKVADTYKGRHVRVILISFDEIEDAPVMRERLKKAGVGFGSFLLNPKDREKVVAALDPKWQDVAVPASFVYDASGKKVDSKLLDVHTFEQWKAVLDPLAKK